jgi:hypothetical protein
LVAALAAAAGCGGPAERPRSAAAGVEWITFEGNWSAAGSRQILRLGPERRAAVFDLSGSLMLTGRQGLGIGFQSRAIGFSDSAAGMQGRAVWTDERGEHVYSELRGQAVGAGNHIVGTFIGGTGRYAGVTGEYEFEWQYVVEAEDGAVSGRVVGLKGRAHLAPGTREPAR